jgi:hypothetical protein
VIEADGGETVYFAGDTGLFGDMKLIGELYRPYVSVLPIGDKYVMGINEASYAGRCSAAAMYCGALQYLSAIMADTDEFIRLSKVRAPHTEVKVIAPAKALRFERLPKDELQGIGQDRA